MTVIPDAEPVEGARFVRVRDLTDEYVVRYIDPDTGETTWERVDEATREQLGDAVCEAMFSPERIVPLLLPVSIVERLADRDHTADDLESVLRAADVCWGGLDYVDRFPAPEPPPQPYRCVCGRVRLPGSRCDCGTP